MNKTGRIVLITGAGSGIGEACAHKYAQNGDNLIITGRRNERLQSLKKLLISKYSAEIKVLCFDVQKYSEAEKAVNSLEDRWRCIDIILNNAGLALGLNTIQDGMIEDWETMIDTNIKGLLYITRLVVPEMIKRQKGHIINIGSIAGKEVYPKGNVYCATKHAVEALSKAMRIDLLPHGIKVTQIAPGAVNTEFSLVRYKGDIDAAEKVYEGFTPLLAEDIAEAVFFASSLPSRVNINDMLIMPVAQATAAMIHKEKV